QVTDKQREQRGSEFVTIEAPVYLAGAIRTAECDAMVVDCLTLWLSNMMQPLHDCRGSEVDEAIEAANATSALVIVVTNDVGCGIVPENALAREFRDRAGIMNQRF